MKNINISTFSGLDFNEKRSSQKFEGKNNKEDE